MANYLVKIYRDIYCGEHHDIHPDCVLGFQANGLTRDWAKAIKAACRSVGDYTFAHIYRENELTASFYVAHNRYYDNFIITLCDPEMWREGKEPKQYERLSIRI